MSSANSTLVCAAIGVTFQLIRLSIDLIASVSITSVAKSLEEQESKLNIVKKSASRTVDGKTYGAVPSYGSLTGAPAPAPPQASEEEAQPPTLQAPKSRFQQMLPVLSTVVHAILLAYFVTACILASLDYQESAYSAVALGAAAVAVLIGLVLNARDFARERFGSMQRTLYVLCSLILLTSCVLSIGKKEEGLHPAYYLDWFTLAAFISYAALSLIDSQLCRFKDEADEGSKKKPLLSGKAMYTILKPYFWPDATSSSALVNRIRAILTWFCVAGAKMCNLISPILLGRASTALAHLNYSLCIHYSISYAMVNFLGSSLKEGQSLIYLKVTQAAFVQLAETAFHHLHSLSLDWHLRKKLGEVIRSMDRGISACDTLMKYLFLWLVPALVECLMVVIIFHSYFDYFPLAICVLFFVVLYITWTILVTMWRKKFRKAVTKSDNDWHDLCTDSLVNFETVKYFTAEQYERKRFGDAVRTYQSGSVNVQASLSFLNISQQLILQTCMATCLSLAALGIKRRVDCCVDHGCDSGVSDCCANLKSECPGMEVGDFISVLAYTLNLFQPLNFLGSVYNAIVMAIIDLTNLSEILAENPDVTDAPDAMPVPKLNKEDPDVAVEFDNVYFHYPSQPATKGLKGLSFKMKRGTVTAFVGSTGAGKTTISRLFFRFYDVLGGAVKVNGVDVRALSQKSLRDSIGVVPQATSLFNESIKENILYGKRDASMQELETAARDAQIMSFIESLPDGWETLVGDRGLKLSGGEKQRTAIARCLLKDPPFVVLDEATSALDSVTENSVQEALDSLGSERTCMIIAHRLGTIRNADNIIVLGDGRVEEEGTHDELMARNGKYAELWNMQLHSTSRSSSLSNLKGSDTD